VFSVRIVCNTWNTYTVRINTDHFNVNVNYIYTHTHTHTHTYIYILRTML